MLKNDATIYGNIAKEYIKYCVKCDSYKRVEAFYKDDRFCINCQNAKQDSYVNNETASTKTIFPDFDLTGQREKYFQTVRNISLERIHYLIKRQNYRCAICEIELNTLPQKQIHVDHDHKTGKTRGVLCSHCNAGLGMFRDNTNSLVKAIEYLQVVR